MPVLVRNQETGPTVFSDPVNNLSVEWGGKGDPSGSDSQYVPDDLFKNAAFMKAVQRGIFVRVDEADEADVLDQQAAAYQGKQQAAAQATAGTIVTEANNDLVQAACQGPANRGQGNCGEPVPVKDKDQDAAPILCPRHQSLASEFIQMETGEMKDIGDALVPVKKWVRTTVTPRARQQQ